MFCRSSYSLCSHSIILKDMALITFKSFRLFSLLWLLVELVRGNDEYWDNKNEIISCGGVLRSPYGVIRSPNYPHPYPNFTDCTWIVFPPTNSVVILSMKDMDVEPGVDCDAFPCCTHDWLSLPSEDGEGYFHICGKQIIHPPLKITAKKINISFKSSLSIGLHRGFKLEYKIERMGCQLGEFMCDINQCLPISYKCDGYIQCNDNSDEKECSVCGPTKVQCNPTSRVCYSPTPDKCDGIRHCPGGEDEIGCENLCEEDPRKCNGRRCSHYSFWCDGNCSDSYDEESCMRNSIISLTIMGCLICVLCVVLVVLCSLRMYTRRQMARGNYRLPISAFDNPRLNLPHSLTLPPIMDEEFFHREPPPSYSVAVAQNDGMVQCNHLMQDPPPYYLFCQSNVKTRSPSSETSNQSSPGRDSVTSSSYLSNEGNETLIDL